MAVTAYLLKEFEGQDGRSATVADLFPCYKADASCGSLQVKMRRSQLINVTTQKKHSEQITNVLLNMEAGIFEAVNCHSSVLNYVRAESPGGTRPSLRLHQTYLINSPFCGSPKQQHPKRALPQLRIITKSFKVILSVYHS